MNNQTIQIKVQERLNKLSSADYGNIECWQITEAFNKAQLNWVRRQLEGINQTRSGSEGSRRRIDDLQFILTTTSLPMVDKGIYWESKSLPDNYMEWNRLSANAKDCCCPERPLVIFLAEEADRDILLMDDNRQPNFDWATTFATLSSNTIRLYTNDQFDIVSPTFSYFALPVPIEIAGCVNVATGVQSPVDIPCQANDSVIEVLIEEAAAILSGDLDNYLKQQILTQSTEHNT